MTPLLRRVAGLVLWLLSVSALADAAATPAQWPRLLAEGLAAEADDPQRALGPLRQRAGQARGEDRFWLLLGQARLESALELDDDVATTLQQAEAALSGLPGAEAQSRQWLRLAQLRYAVFTQGGVDQLSALAAFRRDQAPTPSALRCEALDTETWLLTRLRSLDEAWRAADELDACGAAIGGPMFQAQAALTRGQVAADVQSGPDAPQRVVEHFRRAEALAGSGRFLHSLVSYAAGTSLAAMKRPQEALQSMQSALEASRSLQDAVGVAAALIEIAALDLDLGRPADALAALDESVAQIRGRDDASESRAVRVHALRLRAAARLRSAELPGLVARTARLDLGRSLPQGRQALELAQAEALAVLGRHAEAYEAMHRARTLDVESRQLARDAQVLLLQARYDTAKRDAEIAALRFKEESAQLSLRAQQATQRGLWTALAAAVVALAAASVLGWHSWRRRRELAHLALRDELTGLPNRRAIETYARAQLRQAERLGLPFSLALIDLDRFKQINDQRGHDIGDQVLKAFAAAVPSALRAPDRLGRWGGEEFLVVLPGTPATEMGGVFARLLTAFAAADVEGMPSPHGVTFSLGGAAAGDGATYETLLKRADERLFAAKDAGRATWR